MNPKEQEQFFSFLTEQLERHPNIYMNKSDNVSNGFFFYGDGNTEVSLSSEGSTVHILLNEADFSNKKKIIAQVDIPFSEAKSFIQKVYDNHEQQKIHEWIREDHEHYNFMIKELQYIKEYLKSAKVTNEEIDDKTTISIPSLYGSKDSSLKAGQLMTYGTPYKPAVCELIGNVTISINLYPPNSPNKHIYLEFPLAGWDIKESPCMQQFVKVNYGAENMAELLKTLKEKNPELGSMLHYHILNNELDNKTTVKKTHKI